MGSMREDGHERVIWMQTGEDTGEVPRNVLALSARNVSRYNDGVVPSVGFVTFLCWLKNCHLGAMF